MKELEVAESRKPVAIGRTIFALLELDRSEVLQ